MTPIPAEAMPVVEVLRRDVPRPTDIPYLNLNYGCLRWLNGCCPMGLHPQALDEAPADNGDFAGGECSKEAVDSFWHWWDSLKWANVYKAMDAIWPPVEGS